VFSSDQAHGGLLHFAVTAEICEAVEIPETVLSLLLVLLPQPQTVNIPISTTTSFK